MLDATEYDLSLIKLSATIREHDKKRATGIQRLFIIFSTLPSYILKQLRFFIVGFNDCCRSAIYGFCGHPGFVPIGALVLRETKRALVLFFVGYSFFGQLFLPSGYEY